MLAFRNRPPREPEDVAFTPALEEDLHATQNNVGFNARMFAYGDAAARCLINELVDHDIDPSSQYVYDLAQSLFGGVSTSYGNVVLGSFRAGFEEGEASELRHRRMETAV